MIRTAINYLSFIFAGVLLLAAAAVAHFWPASYWLEVRSIRVFDSKVGAPVVMAVDRTIKRDFQANWVSTIKRLDRGKWVSYCTADATTNYDRRATLPDPLFLQWWTFPGCHPLPAGKFILRTTWRIEVDGLVPDKWVTEDSNIFEVTP